MKPAFQVMQILFEETGSTSLTPDTSFDELGLDSLEFVDLMVKVSAETGVEIPVAKFGEMNRISDLIRFVEK